MSRYTEFETKTGGRLDILDITSDVRSTVESSGVTTGAALVFSPHTTCSIFVTGNGADLDLEAAVEAVAPAEAYYAHDDLKVRTENLTDDEPPNAPAHLFHAFQGRPSARFEVKEGSLVMGSGVRIYFVELCSSRPRRYSVHVVGD